MPGGYGYVGYQPIKLGALRIGAIAGVRTRSVFLARGLADVDMEPVRATSRQRSRLTRRVLFLQDHRQHGIAPDADSGNSQ